MVDEFSLESGGFVDELTTDGEGRELQRPAALAVDSRGDVYVADQEARVVDVWGAGAYFPSVVLGQAAARTATGARLEGTVNPAQGENENKAPVTECYFQYIPEAEYEVALAKKEAGGFPKGRAAEAQCSPDASEISLTLEPEAEHPVQGQAVSLRAGVPYRYRLVAVTQEGSLTKGGLAASAAAAFTPPAPPKVVSSSAGNVSSAFADLHAQIDPAGAATSYRFEYDTRPYSSEGEAAHGVSVPVPDATVGAGGPTGSGVESVVQHAVGLTPATTYYFRVVAVNEVDTSEETAQSKGSFTTLPAVHGLPDSRGYELVTPAVKQGGSDMFAEPHVNEKFENTHDVGTPSEDGEGFLLETDSAFGEFPFAFTNAYVFRRDPGAGDWSFTSLAARSLEAQDAANSVIFDPSDLSRVALNDAVGVKEGQEGTRLTNLLGPPGAPGVCQGSVLLEGALANDCYIELHQDPATHVSVTTATNVVGASRDLGHVILESPDTGLCGGAGQVTHGDVLCEWAGGYQEAGGETRPVMGLVNVNDEGAPVSVCGATLGSLYDHSSGGAYRAVSADGARVFFTAPGLPPEAKLEGKEGCWNRSEEQNQAKPPKNAPQLYMRVKKTEPGGEAVYRTLKVSAPEEGVSLAPSEEYPAMYAGASEDGSKVFFVTRTELTGEAVALKLHHEQLYECEITETSGEPGCVLTRVSAGDTGFHAPDPEVSKIYAVAGQGSAVYFNASEALAPEATNTGGVYRYDTETHTTSYIAISGQWEPTKFDSGACAGGQEVALCSLANWYATPNGQYLLFNTSAGLTRYNADAGEEHQPALICVSCSPEGQPASAVEFARSAPFGPAKPPVRAMSDDGSYVFFDTPTPLVPQATNGSLNTYEWHENQGTHEQTLSLIGSGSELSPTYFLGYAPNPAAHSEQAREGGSVFIGTHAKLSPQDTNSVGNIYDARVCEPESPCIQPPLGETKQCEGGSCQTPPPAPIDATPGSFTFRGPGNLSSEVNPVAVTKKATPKCRSGYVRKKIKKKQVCVRKPKSKKRAKKSSHRKGSH